MPIVGTCPALRSGCAIDAVGGISTTARIIREIACDTTLRHTQSVGAITIVQTTNTSTAIRSTYGCICSTASIVSRVAWEALLGHALASEAIGVAQTTDASTAVRSAEWLRFITPVVIDRVTGHTVKALRAYQTNGRQSSTATIIQRVARRTVISDTLRGVIITVFIAGTRDAHCAPCVSDTDGGRPIAAVVCTGVTRFANTVLATRRCRATVAILQTLNAELAILTEWGVVIAAAVVIYVTLAAYTVDTLSAIDCRTIAIGPTGNTGLAAVDAEGLPIGTTSVVRGVTD